MSGTLNVPRVSGRPPQGEPLLVRAFRILACFRVPGEALTLAALSSRAGLPKSSALRISTQLADLGALERQPDGRFVVGLRMLELATMAPRGHGLRQGALTYMQDLHRVTNEHVQLAVREGSEAVLIERLSSRNAVAVAHHIGGRLPLDQTGVGIALLAHAPEVVLTEVFSHASAGAETAKHHRRVRQLMAVVRREGVLALTGPNPVRGGPAEVTTVAAPIVDGQGQAHAAISIVLPGAAGGSTSLKLALRTASLGISRAAGT